MFIQATQTMPLLQILTIFSVETVTHLPTIQSLNLEIQMSL